LIESIDKSVSFLFYEYILSKNHFNQLKRPGFINRQYRFGSLVLSSAKQAAKKGGILCIHGKNVKNKPGAKIFFSACSPAAPVCWTPIGAEVIFGCIAVTVD